MQVHRRYVYVATDWLGIGMSVLLLNGLRLFDVTPRGNSGNCSLFVFSTAMLKDSLVQF